MCHRTEAHSPSAQAPLPRALAGPSVLVPAAVTYGAGQASPDTATPAATITAGRAREFLSLVHLFPCLLQCLKREAVYAPGALTESFKESYYFYYICLAAKVIKQLDTINDNH